MLSIKTLSPEVRSPSLLLPVQFSQKLLCFKNSTIGRFVHYSVLFMLASCRRGLFVISCSCWRFFGPKQWRAFSNLIWMPGWGAVHWRIIVVADLQPVFVPKFQLRRKRNKWNSVMCDQSELTWIQNGGQFMSKIWICMVIWYVSKQFVEWYDAPDIWFVKPTFCPISSKLW